MSATMIDVAAKLDSTRAIGEETARWFWRFTICTGCVCRDQQTTVQRHAVALLDVLKQQHKAVTKEILLKGVSSDPERLLQEWSKTLEVLSRQPQMTRKYVEWFGS